MSSHYKRFIQVLEKWPIDKTKSGRDLGEKLRERLQTLADPSAIKTQQESENLNKEIDALERLANNTYAKKYPRAFNSTATGLTAEQCSQVLSSEFLQYLNKDNK